MATAVSLHAAKGGMVKDVTITVLEPQAGRR